MHNRLITAHRRGKRASWGGRGTFGLGLTLLLAWTFILGQIAPVFASGSGRLILSDLNTNAFPAVLFSLELLDSHGVFVSDLKPDELALREDGQELPVQDVKIQPRRLQFSLAVNAAPGMEARPANVQPDNPANQLEAVRQELLRWAARQTSAQGDYSFATATGMQVIRAREAGQLADGLKAYQPDLGKAQSSLFSLSSTLDLASEPDGAESASSKPAVLFVTPPLGEKESADLTLQAERAVKIGAAVFVWLVTPDAQKPPEKQEALQQLANATGGQLALVSAGQAFPNLESWLEPLRQIYQVSYNSQLQKSGDHTLAVQVKRAGLQLSSERDLRFSFDVRPPNPIFVQPPALVERAWSAADNQQAAELSPASLPLEVVIEFPDGHMRPLKATRLFLNDQQIAENTAEPFTRFTWKLDGLTQSASLKLRVEAQDTLGLSGTSIEVPVELRVAPKPSNSLLPHVSTQGMIAAGAVLLAGLVLGLVILGENRLRRRQNRGTRRQRNDPVTQPVAIPQAATRPRKAPAAPLWPRVERAASSPARLVRLNEHEHPAPGGPLAINRSELTFGSDAHLAIIALDDPSVQALHARLIQREGNFILQDEKSVAGTWVNYVQLNGKGRKLAHGDLIHMGRVMFRFELSDPPPALEPQVSLVDEAL